MKPTWRPTWRPALRPALRPAIHAALGYLVPLLLALLVSAVLIRAAGQDPWVALKALFDGATGSRNRLAETGARTIPLILTGLSVALAFKAGFFNVGAEGQFLMGALLGTAAGTKLGLPWPLLAVAGSLGGAAWALVAGWLKIKRGAPEIITTIMLNYVALQLVAFSLHMPGEGDSGGWLLQQQKELPQSDVLPSQSQVPALVADTSLHAGLLVAMAAAGLVWWLLFRTERGFLWRAAGEGALAARVQGIAVNRNAYGAIALSGALAGLAGALEVAGATKQLNLGGFSYGYTAIAVALLANLNPLVVIPSGLVFGVLAAGGGAMERSANVPAVAVQVVTGVVIFALAAISSRKKAK